MTRVTARHPACGFLWCWGVEVNPMNSNPDAFSAEATQDFYRLFNTTVMAFERDALRISKQIRMAAPEATRKRSNGKQVS